MRVIINRCYGGFGLSDKASELCIERGMTVSDNFDEYGKNRTDFVYCDRYRPDCCYAPLKDEKEFRTNPVVLSVVEELGKGANGKCAELKIIDIPFDSLDGWEINEYDGMERIIHSGSWC